MWTTPDSVDTVLRKFSHLWFQPECPELTGSSHPALHCSALYFFAGSYETNRVPVTRWFDGGCHGNL